MEDLELTRFSQKAVMKFEDAPMECNPADLVLSFSGMMLVVS